LVQSCGGQSVKQQDLLESWRKTKTQPKNNWISLLCMFFANLEKIFYIGSLGAAEIYSAISVAIQVSPC
jgi:hypothetical protein